MKKKVFAAMSGGIDSSVAAYLLLREGYDVTGATMTLYHPDPTQGDSLDVRDARSVCKQLGIPHVTYAMEDDFRRAVIDDFISVYEAGGTPNPCVTCNKRIKFGTLMNAVTADGGDLMATGHYARVQKDGNGRTLLLRGRDESKDQSYFLWQLTEDVLSRVLFPLGDMTKGEIRELGQALNLSTAHKSDSQDICFVPDGKYAEFIEAYTGKVPRGGCFVDEQGNILGQHRGIIHYTVGQRKGLGIALGAPMFVLSKNPLDNTVTLGGNSSLFTNEVYLKDLNLIATDRLDAPMRVWVKLRSTHKGAMATLEATGERTARLTFDEAQRAAAMGQSAVFYDGDVVVGGGVITV